jgi:hypothetical protein
MATVRQLLDRVDTWYDSQATDAEKVTFMNEALTDLNEYFGLVKEDATLSTVADQDIYALPAGVGEIANIISIAIANSATPSSRYDYTRYTKALRDEDPQRTQCFYQVMDSDGDKFLVFYPVPATADYDIVIRYRKPVAELSTTVFTGTPEFDSRYHDVLVFWCCHAICARGASPDTIQANMFMQKYEDMMRKLKMETMRREEVSKHKRRSNPQWSRTKSISVFEEV